MSDIDSHREIGETTSSAFSEFNVTGSLLHLLSSQQNQEGKLEAEVHPKANLDMLTGQHRGPAVPLSLLKENPHVCIACGVDFKCNASLHAHLMRHRHIFGTLEQFTKLPKYECRSCEGAINCSSMLKHKCFSKQQNDIRDRIKLLDRDGSPMVCIICRGRLFPSRVHLIIHIIVAHSIHRDPYRCVFCQTQFHSENLMMQEVHAFDCHAPELFMITRKACFKMIRNPQGTVANASVPFTCFYDASKLEGRDLRSIFRPKHLRPKLSNMADLSSDDQTVFSSVNKAICTATFDTLDEYTAHLCSFHGAVAPNQLDVAQEEDPVQQVRRRVSRTNRVPGPTVRELLRSQATGQHAPMKPDEDFEPPRLSGLKASQKSTYRPRKSEWIGPQIKFRGKITASMYVTPVVKHNEKMREMCRICLEYFPDEQRLNSHIEYYHLPESKKRFKHLVDKHKLRGILDINLLCTECYILFPDILALQIHMMVSHASKDWRHCGLCNYEFYSENGGTPNHLRLVKFSSAQDSLATAGLPWNPVLSDGGRSMDSWPLPAELMWRMIMTHETRHRERLFQPRPVPYLPLGLLDQLMSGKAIQAVMAANWLSHKAQEEIEGVYSSDEPMPNVPELITTEEAFADGPNKIKQLGVDEDAVKEDKALLISILEKNEENQDTLSYDSSLGRPSTARTSSTLPSRLPQWLVRKLTEIGELNAAKQVEIDFMDNLY